MRNAKNDMALCKAATSGSWDIANTYSENGVRHFVLLNGIIIKGGTSHDSILVAEARAMALHWIRESQKWKEHLESAETALQTMIDECDCNDCPYKPGKYAELVHWRRRAQELRRENEAFRDLLDDIYPAVAGQVIEARRKCENSPDVKLWNDYCHKILELIKEAE